MKNLHAFLKPLTQEQRETFAERVNSTVRYLIKISLLDYQKIDIKLVVDIHKHTFGAVPLWEMRPDVDWKYLRDSLNRIGERDPVNAPRALVAALESADA